MPRHFSRVQLFACQTPLSMGFFKQEYQSGLPYLSPGDLPDQGLNPYLFSLPALAGGFLPLTVPENSNPN